MKAFNKEDIKVVTVKKFGKTVCGDEISLYSLKNENGMQADVMDFGAILVNLFVPNKNGEVADVVLGYDRAKDYFVNGSCFGGTIGPIANRTADATYELDGTHYNLIVNDGPNNLHTDGDRGLHKVMWDAMVNESENSVTFSCEMQDGYLGLPGNRHFKITYQLTEDNALQLHYYGDTDKKTLMNLTDHSYFNLKGEGCEKTIEDITVTINASKFVAVRRGAIPTGELLDVEGTAFDFREPHVVAERIDADEVQIALVGGYDHSYAIDGYAPGKLVKAATALDKEAGRCLEVYTDLPGVQFYTGNNMVPELGKNDALYPRRGGFCFETNFFPNCANEPNFIKPVVEPGKPFTSTTVYKFV